MTFSYMMIWSAIMVVGFSFFRVRQLRHTVLMTVVTFLILAMTHALFVQLSLGAGINPAINGQISLTEYIYAGLIGWLALLVMPCGWLGPVVGLHLAERLQRLEMNR